MASPNARTNFFIPMVGSQLVEMRIVWPWLADKRVKDWKGNPLPPDKQRYEATFIVPKLNSNPFQCANYMSIASKLMEIVALQPGWNGQWPGQTSAEGPTKWPLTDCDLKTFIPPQAGTPFPKTPRPDFLEKNPWAAGHWMFRASSNNPVIVVDAGNNPIPKGLDGNFLGLKGGDYVDPSINAACSTTGTGGVGIYFEAIKKTRDGEPIGGGTQRSPQDIFGAASGAPVYQAVSAPPLPPGTAPQGYPTQAPYSGGGSPTSGAAPYPAPAVAPPLATQPAPYAAPSTGAYPSSGPAPAYAPPSAPPGVPTGGLNPAAYATQGAPAYAPPAPAGGYAGAYPSSAPPAPAGQPVAPPAYGTRG